MLIALIADISNSQARTTPQILLPTVLTAAVSSRDQCLQGAAVRRKKTKHRFPWMSLSQMMSWRRRFLSCPSRAGASRWLWVAWRVAGELTRRSGKHRWRSGKKSKVKGKATFLQCCLFFTPSQRQRKHLLPDFWWKGENGYAGSRSSLQATYKQPSLLLCRLEKWCKKCHQTGPKSYFLQKLVY